MLNSHILFFNGYRRGPPSYKVECYKTHTNPYYIFPQWERVHLVVYNLCPFIIMLICNIYIISVTIRSARIRTSRITLGARGSRSSSTSRHRQLSIMLILVTFAFVLLTLPSCIYFVFFRHEMSSKRFSRTFRHMVQICLSSTQFTSHAINFFLYCFSATNFRNELEDFVKEIFLCRANMIESRKSIQITTAVNLSTINKSHRRKKKLNTEITLEYEKTEYQDTMGEVQLKENSSKS